MSVLLTVRHQKGKSEKEFVIDSGTDAATLRKLFADSQFTGRLEDAVRTVIDDAHNEVIADAQRKGKFPVSLLWQVAALKDGDTRHKNEELFRLGERMFPGISWVREIGIRPQTTAVRKLIKPELDRLFPELAGFSSEKEAVKSMGKNIQIPEIRKMDYPAGFTFN